MIPNSHSHSLKIKINILVIPVSVCILSLAGLVSFLGASNSLSAELGNRAERIVIRLENALRIPLWGYNIETAKAFVLAELKDPDAISIIVRETGDSEAIWFAYIRDAHGEVHFDSEESAQINYKEPGALTVYGTIDYNDNEIGRIQIIYSTSSAMAEIRSQTFILVSGVIGLILVLATALNTGLNRLVVRPLENIIDRMHVFSEEQGGALEFVENGDEISQLSSAFDQMLVQVRNREGALTRALAEKEILLREVHHRVKNNFQVLASLFSLQMPKVSDEAAESLREGYNRIYSMSLVHEKLYESDSLDAIDFADYLYELTGILGATYGSGDINLVLESDEVQVDLDTAIPLGLILNEAVSNAYKHAFSDISKANKKILLSCRCEGQHIIVTVSDNGKGLPDGFDAENDGSLGMDLIVNLSSQLDAEWTIDSSTLGTQVRLRLLLS